jgi:D-alanyl-D-alanine carboxypeptidase
MRTWRRAVTALTLATAVAVPLAVSATAGASESAPTATLQRDLDGIVSAGLPSAQAEIRDGRQVWRAGSGTVAAGGSRPVDPTGAFRAGSVTKTFVATVIMQLVAEHRLRLDEPVDRWLPGLLPDRGPITVRELLNHTSGLYNLTDALPLNPPIDFLPLRWKTWTTNGLVKFAIAHGSLFDPGTEYHYSDTDYLVLGLLINRVTGRSYAQEINDRILRPLGLRHTEMPGTDPRISGSHAHGYLPDGKGGVVDITEFNPSVMNSAGEIISTTDDLNRFTGALLGGRLLPPAQLTEMLAVSAPSQTGLGLEVRSLSCGRTAYGHDGDALGFSAWTFGTAGGRRTVSLSVTWGPNRPTQAAVTKLLDDALC